MKKPRHERGLLLHWLPWQDVRYQISVDPADQFSRSDRVFQHALWNGCWTCHSLTPHKRLLGRSLSGFNAPSRPLSWPSRSQRTWVTRKPTDRACEGSAHFRTFWSSPKLSKLDHCLRACLINCLITAFRLPSKSPSPLHSQKPQPMADLNNRWRVDEIVSGSPLLHHSKHPTYWYLAPLNKAAKSNSSFAKSSISWMMQVRMAYHSNDSLWRLSRWLQQF